MDENIKKVKPSLLQVFDFRFFDVQTFTNPIIFLIHNENPDKNLINLINELDCLKIYTENIFESDLEEE